MESSLPSSHGAHPNSYHNQTFGKNRQQPFWYFSWALNYPPLQLAQKWIGIGIIVLMIMTRFIISSMQDPRSTSHPSCQYQGLFTLPGCTAVILSFFPSSLCTTHFAQNRHLGAEWRASSTWYTSINVENTSQLRVKPLIPVHIQSYSSLSQHSLAEDHCST